MVFGGGHETVAAEGREEKHPCRMSVVCEKRDGRWLLTRSTVRLPTELAARTLGEALIGQRAFCAYLGRR